MQHRRIIGFFMVVAILAGATGCDAVKRKLTRKRENERPPEPIFALQKEYRPEWSPDVRYQAHFAYWKAAHDDLLEHLGEGTQKRRMSAAAQAIKELQALRVLLTAGPAAEGLTAGIQEMEQMETRLAEPLLDMARLNILRSALESLRRRIDKAYDYHRVKDAIISEQPAPPEGVTSHQSPVTSD